MTIGSIKILIMLLNRFLDGDLTQYSLKQYFRKYLEEKKLVDIGDTIIIDDEMELWPKMIEALYEFLLSNSKYVTVVFGDKVRVKGEVDNYFKLIDFGKDQGQLSNKVDVEFKNQNNKSQIQIIAELTTKMMFKQFLVLDSQIEYK